jgi:hypothetical protein
LLLDDNCYLAHSSLQWLTSSKWRALTLPNEWLTIDLNKSTKLFQFTDRHANDEALRLFNRALIELDPDFASAYGRVAFCHAYAKTNGWISGTANEIAEVARRFARGRQGYVRHRLEQGQREARLPNRRGRRITSSPAD